MSEVRRTDLLFVWITVRLYFSELRKSLDKLSMGGKAQEKFIIIITIIITRFNGCKNS